jgi:two-component sensor histidine kinase
MAVHELATNASKYGSLSVSTGRVAIRWEVEGAERKQLSFSWQEAGGPPVLPPARKGFGTRLIERSLAEELTGEVRLAYEAAGLVCLVKAPLGEDAPPRAEPGDHLA